MRVHDEVAVEDEVQEGCRGVVGALLVLVVDSVGAEREDEEDEVIEVHQRVDVELPSDLELFLLQQHIKYFDAASQQAAAVHEALRQLRHQAARLSGAHLLQVPLHTLPHATAQPPHQPR